MVMALVGMALGDVGPHDHSADQPRSFVGGFMISGLVQGSYDKQSRLIKIEFIQRGLYSSQRSSFDQELIDRDQVNVEYLNTSA